MGKILKEQKITSFTPEANLWRNNHRPKVDKLFAIKDASKGKKRAKYDFMARQLWRKIVAHANLL